jgi:hypothetical protein
MKIKPVLVLLILCTGIAVSMYKAKAIQMKRQMPAKTETTVSVPQPKALAYRF